MNSLAAADFLLIALQCEYLALEGLGQILRNVERLKSAHINDELELGGVVMTMFDMRTQPFPSGRRRGEAASARQDFQTVIPRTVRLSEAPELRENDFRLRSNQSRRHRLPQLGEGSDRAVQVEDTRSEHGRLARLSDGRSTFESHSRERRLPASLCVRISAPACCTCATSFSLLTSRTSPRCSPRSPNTATRSSSDSRATSCTDGISRFAGSFRCSISPSFSSCGARRSQGNPTIGGFDLEQTLTYFVTLLVLQFFISAFNEDYQISEEIRNGLINQFLLKPINYFLYRFSIYVAARMVSGALIFMPLLDRDTRSFGSISRSRRTAGDSPWASLPSCSALIQFSIAYCFGMLTFWFLEIQGFVILSMAIEIGPRRPDLPAGSAARRGFFASRSILPFYYQMYFPGRDLHRPHQRSRCICAAWSRLIGFGWVISLCCAIWHSCSGCAGLRRHTRSEVTRTLASAARCCTT